MTATLESEAPLAAGSVQVLVISVDAQLIAAIPSASASGTAMNVLWLSLVFMISFSFSAVLRLTTERGPRSSKNKIQEPRSPHLTVVSQRRIRRAAAT